ncbi:death domain-associated protein 6-like [Clavelina lepadiformis]|uniref:death domain-associated protein 6-like n=1 Tax=Clavelina lepadiformis TaxID=159417 RepID=UPI004041F148
MSNDIILISSESEEELPIPSQTKSDESNSNLDNPPKSPNSASQNGHATENCRNVAHVKSDSVDHINDDDTIETFLEKFIQACQPLIEEAHNPDKLIKLIRTRHAKASNEFKSSTTYFDMLNRYIKKLQAGRKCVYVYINDITTVLEQHRKKPVRRHLSLTGNNNDASESAIKKARIQPIPFPSDSESVNNESESSVTNHEDQPSGTLQDDEETKRTQRKIEHLEGLLKKFSDEIKRLQAHELTLDEMEEEDSIYIQEGLLKKKCMKVFQKLCDIQKVPMRTGRVIERNIKLSGTRFPELNKKVESYVNRVKKFPDYQDIQYLVKKGSEKRNLQLTTSQIQNEAENLFKEVGEQLQRIRHYDFVYNFGSYLTDNTLQIASDPAKSSPELQKKLSENRAQSKLALKTVIEKYSKEQEDLGASSSKIPDNGEGNASGSDPPSEADFEKESDDVVSSNESVDVIELSDEN